ncbi:MAG: hypothetical protein SPI64_04280 [Anaerovibrio sp.]|nr:hypothetical protein [Anaerovibrio sp.]
MSEYMEDVKGSWGGKRAGAGRPKGSTKEDSNIRKQHQVRAHEEEWELIKEFATLVKKDINKARQLLGK